MTARTRSRTGCGTCKDFRKKCDEQFDANGSCARCRRIGSVCRAESTRPSRSQQARATPIAPAIPPMTSAPAIECTEDLGVDIDAIWADLLGPFAAPEESVDQELMQEIDEESSKWWNYYDSLNEGYFVSLPKARRREMATAIRRDMGDRVGRAAITFMAFAHYAALCEESGGDYKEWDERAMRCGRFAKQAIEKQAGGPCNDGSLGPLLDTRTALIQRYSTSDALSLLDLGVAMSRAAGLLLPDTLATHLLIYADTIQAIADPNRIPAYTLCGCAPLMLDIRQTPGHLGLSVDLLICINTILTSNHTSTCNDRLLAFIIDAPPLPMTIRAGDSAAALAVLAMHELWRQATLVLYHTLRTGKGCISGLVQDCLRQARLIAPNLGPLKPPIPFWASASACPWFILSTIAMREEDRELCREHLMAAGTSPTYTGNLRFIENLWTRMEDTGRPVDFRAMIKEGYQIAFL